MRNRDRFQGRAMPRKARHGRKVSRWGTHQEHKDNPKFRGSRVAKPVDY